jgi:hypothetical protein
LPNPVTLPRADWLKFLSDVEKVVASFASSKDWSQSYDHKLQRQRCKTYNTTNSIVRYRNIFFLSTWKQSSLLQRQRCSCR